MFYSGHSYEQSTMDIVLTPNIFSLDYTIQLPNNLNYGTKTTRARSMPYRW